MCLYVFIEFKVRFLALIRPSAVADMVAEVYLTQMTRIESIVEL